MKTHGYNYILKHSIFLIVKSLDASCLARFVCSQDEVEEDSSHGNDFGQRLRAWYVVVKIQ